MDSLQVTSLEERLAPAATPGFLLGIRTTVADFSGDGVPDLVIGRPDGTVKALSGSDGSPLREFAPFGAAFHGPISMAAANVVGDDRPDLIVAAGFGGGPRVQVYDAGAGAPVRDVLVFEETFHGGVSVAAGDVTGDGRADIVVAAGFGGGPRVRAFDGVTSQVVRDVFVYEPEFRGGVTLGVGDSNGDGFADLVVGAGPRGGPRVRVISGQDGSGLRDYFVGDVNARDGVSVNVSDLDGNGLADIATLSDGILRVFAGTNPNPFQQTPSSAMLLGSGDLDGDGFAEILGADTVNVTAYGGASLAATGLVITPGTHTGFAKAAPVAPAPVFNNRAISVGGLAGSLATVQFDRLRAYTANNDEIGVFPVDNANGKVGSLNPGEAGYLDAALAAGRRVAAIQSLTGAATASVSVPGAAFYGVYLINGGTKATSFDAAQFRLLPRNRFAVIDAPNGGFQDYHAVIGELTIDTETVPPSPPPPGGNFENLDGFTKTTTPGTGTTTVSNGSVTLVEGTSFRVGLSKAITIPSTPTVVKVTFDSPVFDTTSADRIRDAFEIAVLAEDGTPLALATGPERDASFNWSEKLSPLAAAGTTSDPFSATINLAGLPAGMPAQLVMRLVNDDGDDTTRVTIHRIDYISTGDIPPAGTPAAPDRANAGAVNLETLIDVTPSVKPQYGRTTLTEDRTILTVDTSLANTGNYALAGRVIVAVGNLSDPQVGVLDADGFLPDGRPYVDFTPEMGESLAAGASTAPRTLRFTNPNRTRFSYDLAVLAGVNRAPEFTSTPVTLVEAGQTYRYAATATDQDHQTITYSLPGAPLGMTLDSVTGLVTWTTTSADFGTAMVRIRATDPLGGSAEQTFSISILTSVPNRPPVFTSTPPTDATVTAPFEVETYKTGSTPMAVTAGNFGNGTSLVTADAGDAVFGFLNANRDAGSLSIGEPHPSTTQTSYVQPISVDLGFEPDTYYGNERYFEGMAVDDVNADGNPDLVVSIATGSADYNSVSRVGHVGVRFGNGDGTFRQGWEATLPLVANRGSSSAGIQYVDVTGDDVKDIVTAQYLGQTILVYKGLAGGTFENAPIITASGGSTGRFVVQDMNADGKPDITLFENNTNGQFRTGLSVHFGAGDGSFGPETYYAAANDNGGPGYVVDVDGQNGPDLVRTNYTDTRVEVRLNDGAGAFGPVLFSGAYGLESGNNAYAQPTTATLADFDGDGKIDIELTTASRGLLFLRGLGDGMFGDNTPSGNKYNYGFNGLTKLNLFPAQYHGNGETVDINGDGKLDVIIGDSQYATVTIGLGNGDGTFDLDSYNVQFVDDIGPKTRGNQLTNHLAVADFNRDGVPDVALGTSSTLLRPASIGIALGDHTGTLRASKVVPFGERQFGNAVVADFTGDGFPDIAAHDGQGILFARGHGDGTFDDYIPGLNGGPAEIHTLITDDFDNDGKMDLAWQGFTGLSVIPTYYQAFGLGNGAFQLAPAIFPPTPANAGRGGSDQEVVSGDFNGDGYADLAYRVTDAQGSGDADGGLFTRVDVLLFDPAAKRFNLITDSTNILGPLNVFPGFYRDEPLGFADLNGDGKGEIFAHAAAVRGFTDRPDTPERLYIWQPTYNQAAKDSAQLFTRTVIDDPRLNGGEGNTLIGFAVGDFNADGKPDFAGAASGIITVSYGNGDFTFSKATVYSTNTRTIRTGDVNGDGRLDLIANWNGFSNGNHRALLTTLPGLADGTFGAPESLGAVEGTAHVIAVGDFNGDGKTDFTTGSTGYYSETFLAAPPGLVAVQSGDINGDGHLDLVGLTTAFDRIKVLLGNGDDTFTRQPDLFAGQSPVDLKLIDANGDSKLDIVTADRIGMTVTVLTNNGTGFDKTAIALTARPSQLAVGDLNGDGRPDLAVISGSGQSLSLVLNSAAGFGPATPSFLNFTPGSVALGDLTGDAKSDVLVSDPAGHRLFILPGNGDGTLAAAKTVALNVAPDQVALGDMNFDGKLDVILTLPDGDRVGVLFNRGDGRFTAPQTIAVGDSPVSLAVADVNGDSKLDILATNKDDTLSVILNRFDPANLYRYTPTAIDPDGDPITFDFDAAPGGMLYDAASGQVLWAPMPDQVGANEVILRAEDGRGGSATQGYTITVTAPVMVPPPVFTSQPVTAIPADGVYQYQPSTTNPGDSALRYSLESGPEGLTVDPTTGEVNWDPRENGLSLGFFSKSSNTILGRGWLSTPDSPSLHSPSVTAEGWFKFDALNTGTYLFRKKVFDGNFGFTNISSWGLWMQGSVPQAFVGERGDVANRIDGPGLNINTWYHIALTFDDVTKTLAMYIDGNLIGTKIFAAPLQYNTEPMIIGGAETLRGTVRGVRVWNTARSQSELVQNSVIEVPSNSPGLVVDYRFEESVAVASAVDSSPFRNNASLVTSYDPYNFPPRVKTFSFLGTHPVTLRVDDGKGGTGTQTFHINIVPVPRGSIAGTVSDPAADWTIYVDENRNGYRDANEAFAVTNASGQYTLPNLLQGPVPLALEAKAGYVTPAVSEVAVASGKTTLHDFSVSATPAARIRGRIARDGNGVQGFAAFLDANGNTVRDAGETIAMTDRAGNYAFDSLAAGSYAVRVDLPPGWNVIDPATGLRTVNLTATADDAGNDFALKASADAASTPVFVSVPVTTATARSFYRYAAVAIDPLGQPVTYELLSGPAAMAVDKTNGAIAWTPNAGDVGTARVILKAANDAGNMAIQDFTIMVAAANSAPFITSGTSAIADVNVPFLFRIYAQDAEQSVLNYSLEASPAGMTIDSSGRILWTPPTIGPVTATVVVSDGVGAETRQTLTVNVQDAGANTAPVMNGARTTALVNQPYVGRATATDAEGDALEFSLDSGPAGMTVTPEGLINWTPADLGAFPVRVQVSDGRGGSDEIDFNIDVQSVLTNRDPLLAEIDPAFAIADTTFARDLSATDADGDAIAFQLISGPSGLSLDGTRGTLRWLPGRDQLGTHAVTVRAVDPLGGFNERTFTVTVRGSGGPPAITSIPPTSVAVGQTYIYAVQADDADGDPLAYSLSAAPAGMSIDAATGVLSWTALAGQVGSQAVIIRVTDGAGGFTTQAFNVVVTAGVPNAAPVIGTLPPLDAVVGTPFVYTLAAVDPESTAITFAVRSAPVGFDIHPNTGVVTWTPTAADIGTRTIVLTATDADGAAAVQSFLLTVSAANIAPIITSTAPESVPQGGIFRYDVIANDPDHEPLSYELLSGPSGMTLDTLGRVAWLTKLDTPLGERSATFIVRDARGGSDTQTISFNVVADTTPPRVAILVQNGLLYPWSTEPARVRVTATDDVGVTTVTLTVDGKPVTLAADGTTTVFFSAPGGGKLRATATDFAGNVGKGAGQISMRSGTEDGSGNELGSPPFTVSIANVNSGDEVQGFVEVRGTARSDEFTEYVLSYRRADETTFRQITRSTVAVTNGVLGTWDTTLLPNEQYVLKLEAFDTFGGTAATERAVSVVGDFKLGNFRLSFADITVPVAGIPITLARTYDTLQATADGELGFGWSLEFRNANLRTGLAKTGLENFGIYAAFKEGTKVYLTLPGGKREGYTFTPDIRALPGFGGNLIIATPRFTPDRGVRNALTVASRTLIVNEFGELFSGSQPYNPAAEEFGGGYTVTTPEGLSYFVNGNTGLLTTATDRNGNTLNFSNSGISGSGVSLAFERDARGRITKAIDPMGESVQYAYDARGNLASVTDREGHVTRFEYLLNPAHYLDKVIDPLGRTGVKTLYDANGRLTSFESGGIAIGTAYDPVTNSESITDELGNTSRVYYDERGNSIEIVDALGQSTRYEYDQDNNRISVRNALGEITRTSYDAFGHVTSETDSRGRTEYYTLTPSGLTAATNRLGQTTQYERDSKGNVLAVIDPLGNRTSITRDTRGLVTSVTDPMQHTRTLGYDSAGRPIQITDPLGHALTFVYDANGNLLTQSRQRTGPTGPETIIESQTFDANGLRLTYTDGDSRTTKYGYDAAGQRTSETSPDGIVTLYGFNEDGSPTTTTHPDGTVTEILRDVLGRPVGVDSRTGVQLGMTIDALGQPTSATAPDGGVSKYQTDALGRLVSLTDPRGNVTIFTPGPEGDPAESIALPGGGTISKQTDALGRVVSETGADGGVTLHIYDAAGREIALTLPDGRRFDFAYDAAGRRIQTTAPDGAITRYEYDAADRVTAIVNPLSGRTEYEYDEAGNRVLYRDPMGRETRKIYSRAGQLTGIQLPTGEQSTWTTDGFGRILSITDFNGSTTTTNYSPNQRTAVIQSGSDVQSVTLGANGKPATTTDGRGTTTFAYDAAGRLTQRVEPDSASVSYTYDTAGNIATITTPGGATAYTYDAANRIATVTDPSGGITSYTYSLAGDLLTTQFPNGTNETRTYDAARRLMRIDQNGPSGLIARYQYERDAANRITRSEELNGRVTTFVYDLRGRLTSETIVDPIDGVRTFSYAYDTVGNRTSVNDSVDGITTYSYDINDRLTASVHNGVVTTYTYDANGQLTSRGTGPTDTVTYTWTAQGRLESVTIPGPGGPTVVQYEYDVEGRRVSRSVNGVVTRYLLDTTRENEVVLREYTPGAATDFVFGQDRISQALGSARNYFLGDAVSGTRQLTNTIGAVAGSYEYDAFGNLLDHGGTAQTAYLYRGEYRDPLSGFDHLRARDLDPATGRFISRDRAGVTLEGIENANRYSFAGGDPINRADPSGEFFPVLLEVLYTVGTALVTAAFTVLPVLAASELVSAVVGGLVTSGISSDLDGLGDKWNGGYSSFGVELAVGVEFGEFLLNHNIPASRFNGDKHSVVYRRTISAIFGGADFAIGSDDAYAETPKRRDGQPPPYTVFNGLFIRGIGGGFGFLGFLDVAGGTYRLGTGVGVFSDSPNFNPFDWGSGILPNVISFGGGFDLFSIGLSFDHAHYIAPGLYDD